MKKILLGLVLAALMAPLAGCVVYDGPGPYYGYPYYRAYPYGYYSYRPYYGYYGYGYRYRYGY
ncbi:MAG TPA: hypothetical protein VGL70_03485 [Candidatus Binatia bacterium]|jgi:hypothetical protein